MNDFWKPVSVPASIQPGRSGSSRRDSSPRRPVASVFFIHNHGQRATQEKS